MSPRQGTLKMITLAELLKQEKQPEKKITKAKKNENEKTLKRAKRLRKEFDFTTGMSCASSVGVRRIKS